MMFRREICIWWMRAWEFPAYPDFEADSFNPVCCNTSTTAAFWFLFATLLSWMLLISRSAVAGVGVYGCSGGFLEKMLCERDEPVACSAVCGELCERGGIPKNSQRRVSEVSSFSLTVVTGKPVPMAVGQSLSGAKELSGLLTTPKWVRLLFFITCGSFWRAADGKHRNRAISVCGAFWYLAYDWNFLKCRRLLCSWKLFVNWQSSLRVAEMSKVESIGAVGLYFSRVSQI